MLRALFFSITRITRRAIKQHLKFHFLTEEAASERRTESEKVYPEVFTSYCILHLPLSDCVQTCIIEIWRGDSRFHHSGAVTGIAFPASEYQIFAFGLRIVSDSLYCMRISHARGELMQESRADLSIDWRICSLYDKEKDTKIN
jgi:hypothetical protein